jgi:hypothetical protein
MRQETMQAHQLGETYRNVFPKGCNFIIRPDQGFDAAYRSPFLRYLLVQLGVDYVSLLITEKRLGTTWTYERRQPSS